MTDIYSDNTSTTGVLTVGGTVASAIDEPFDEDWFQIQLNAGTTYIFDQADSDGIPPTLDTFLRLLDASGTVELAVNDDLDMTTTDSQIVFQALGSGTYYLSAGGFSGDVGDYLLSATEVLVVDDFAGDTSTLGQLSAGGIVNGFIGEAGDQDWFQIQLTAGETYTFDQRFVNDGLFLDSTLRLLDVNGTELAFNDDSNGGINSQIIFTPTTSDSYYLSAEGFFGFSTGGYQLSATTATAGDVVDNTSTLGQLDVGGSVTGQIGTLGDQDWFRIELNAGATYIFDQSFTNDGLFLDSTLRLLDANGSLIAFNDDANNSVNSQIVFTPGSSGTYYLSAEGFAGISTGGYLLRATDVSTGTSTDDYADTTSTTGRLTVDGNVITSVIGEAGDQDWFRITLEADTEYYFNLNNTDNSILDSYLRLLDSNGSVLAFNDDANNSLDSQIVFTPDTSGTYYLSAEGFSISTGGYQLQASETASGDIAGDTSSQGRLSIGSTVTSIVGDALDQDWFQVQLDAGTSYVFDQSYINDGEFLDSVLALLDENGAVLAINDDANNSINSQIIFTPGSSGAYYLSAGGFFGSTGGYQLRATDLSADDLPGNTSTTSQLDIGGSVTGVVNEAGDQDWFRLELTDGNTYIFDQVNSGDGLFLDSTLRLLDASGLVEIAFNDDANNSLNSQIVFSPDVSGTYYLSAQGFDISTGGYQLRASEVSSADDFLSTTATTGRLTVGGAVNGVVGTAFDEDWFQIALDAGTEYYFNLNNSSDSTDLNASFLDTFLRVYDANGIELDSNDDANSSLNSQLVFTPGSNDIYYLSAAGFSDSTGGYQLSATSSVAGDIAADISTLGRLEVGSSVTGQVGMAGDKDWYRIELDAGTTYTFDQSNASNSFLDSTLRLLDTGGSEIAANDDSNNSLNSQIIFTPDTSGTYYLSAEGFLNSTGGYLVRATSNADDDFAGDQSTAASVATDGTITSITGVLDDDSDEDWVQVDLVAGTEYIFSLSGTDGSALDPVLALIDPDGVQLVSSDDANGSLNSQIIFTPETTGTYFLSVTGDLDGPEIISGGIPASQIPGSSKTLGKIITSNEIPESSDNTGTGSAGGGWQLVGSQSGDDDFSGTVDTLGRINNTGSISGVVEAAADEDWFQVLLGQGLEYSFDLAATPGSTLNSYLRLLDNGGSQIAFNNDANDSSNSQLIYTPPADGFYYLSAQGFSNSTGSYLLRSLDINNFDDFAGNTSTTGTIPITGGNGFMTGVIGDSNDQDWFRIRLEAGIDYTFELGDSDTSTLDTVLRLLNGTADEIASDDNSGTGSDSLIQFTPTSGGTYYLSAQGFSGDTGGYQLHVDASDMADIAGNTSTDAVLAIGGTSRSEIDQAGDKDWFQIELEAGSNYAFIQNSADGSFLDSRLRLLDGNGVLIEVGVDIDNTLNSQISFRPSTDGTYYLSAQGQSGSTGAYEIQADFAFSGIRLSGTRDPDNLTGGDEEDELKGKGGKDILTGNDSDDSLNGGGGGDSLFGGPGDDTLLGGKGSDTLDGGEGSDTYMVHKDENGIDSYIDTGVGIRDIDTLDASAVTLLFMTDSFSLSGNGIELVQGSTEGTQLLGDVTGVNWDFTGIELIDISKIKGSTSTDTLTGSANRDKLFGLDGADELRGGAGDDVVKGGGDSDMLDGGAGNDKVKGQGGDDVINGGFGIDTLIGGTGSDTFVFDLALQSSNVDTIKNFDPLLDLIALDDDLFTSLTTSAGETLSVDEFKQNNKGIAKEVDDRIIYNKKTGELFYDPDGSLNDQAILFAILDNAPEISQDDFMVTG